MGGVVTGLFHAVQLPVSGCAKDWQIFAIKYMRLGQQAPVLDVTGLLSVRRPY